MARPQSSYWLSSNFVLSGGEEEEILRETMQEFSALQQWRNTFAGQWEEIAELVDPNNRNTFFYGNFNWPGQKKTDRQVDASGMLALQRFSAICDSLLTPRNMRWHGLIPDADELTKDRQVRLWMEATTRKLFKMRYSPVANFSGQNHQNYRQLGAYGTGAMFVDQACMEDGTPIRALRYKAIPLGELFIRENHQGLVNGFVRWFRLTPEQMIQKWGVDVVPENIKALADQHSQTPMNILHRVWTNIDFDPGNPGPRGKMFRSAYICIEGKCVLSTGGYRVFPMGISRYVQAPGEVYGRSPAMDVLPALKTLNAEKRTFLKQGHRAGDPVLLTADDGLVDGFSMQPGAMNKGGMNADGKPLVGILPTGNIQVTKEMMDEERALINDSFLVSLFQILTETPTMTATEVIERTNEKGILLAPTVGRQQDEYLGPLIHRELDLMFHLGLLDPMPPPLIEAMGAYNVDYCSPLAKAARAQEAAGFMRTVETVKELVNVTQDPSLLDRFDFDTAIPEIADIQSVPAHWMADDQAVAQKRQARAKAQAQQQAIQAAPAQAAIMKAQAAQAKAGQGGPPTSQVQGPGPPVPIVGAQQ